MISCLTFVKKLGNGDYLKNRVYLGGKRVNMGIMSCNTIGVSVVPVLWFLDIHLHREKTP